MNPFVAGGVFFPRAGQPVSRFDCSKTRLAYMIDAYNSVRWIRISLCSTSPHGHKGTVVFMNLCLEANVD